jgi:hypothetical protein
MIMMDNKFHQHTQAPSNHRSMSLENRVENALTGFCLLDMFQMLSASEAKRRGFPKGSLFLASQTVLNLQQSALAMVAVGLTKNEHGSFWSRGDHRMTELPIERHFGRLRSQSANAQHNARSFWRASAKHMMRSLVNFKPGRPSAESVPPLSNSEFYRVSERAFSSALRLAAYCEGCTPDSLQEMYTSYCQSGEFLRDDPPLGDEDDFLEAEEDAMGFGNDIDETKAFFENLQTEAAMDAEEQDEDDHATTDETGDPGDILLEKVPDGTLLQDLFNQLGDQPPEDAPPQSPSKGACPIDAVACNLYHAFWCLGAQPDESEVFDSVWRLTMYLRHWQGGADRTWIKDARTCRRKSARLNWYQHLGSEHW